MRFQDNNAFLMAMGENSRIEIHAKDAAKDSWTQIDETADVDSTTLTLSEDTGWEIGDSIVIASTGFEMNEAEYRTITSVSNDGRTITLDAPLEHSHFGEIESHNNGLEGDAFQSWELDMRAEVALLSRNVTIQGDAESSSDGYGGHTMVMNGASMHIDGAELTKMGQIGDVGRYPLHWHMIKDASGQYVTNSSIHETYNKGITIHGTENTWIENNAIVNTIGHTYYFEDGSEEGNVLVDNLGMNTVASASVEVAAIGSDNTAVSTYWLTNPNNHLINNHAAGSDDTGFWVLSQDHTEGVSSMDEDYADVSPRAANPGVWKGNVSHSNADDGFWIGTQFDESTGDKAGENVLEQPFRLEDFTSFKNGEWGIWIRNGRGDLENIRIADSNAGIQNWGDSNLSDSLFVGRSLNSDDTLDQHVGWQLYDHPFSFTDVHFAGFTGEFDAAISNGWGFGRSTAHSVEGLTFADDGTAENTFLHTLTIEPEAKVSDQGGVVAGAINDLDGSLTGAAGGVLTPGIVDYNPGKHFDIATYAFEDIAASGFNASAGAEWQADNRAWIHNPETVIGKMAIIESHFVGDELQAVALEDRAVYTVERSDNGAKILVNQDAMVSYSWLVQLNVDTSDGVEYIFEYADEIPDVLTVDLSDLPEDATVYYRFKGLPDDIVVQEADAAASIEDFNAATGTTWFQEENGDYVVKAVADRFLHWRSPRTDTEFGEERVFNDEFKFFIAPRDGIEATGDGLPYTSRAEHPFVEAVPTELPERQESTSNTVEITDEDRRWSDEGTWGNDMPGLEDIVIIGQGERVVLDTDVTVKAILINGGELVVEDTKDLALASDWVLVVNGGLFQVGSEDNPFQHDFELTLEGDDQDNDVDVMALMMSQDENIVRVSTEDTPDIPTETTTRTVEDTENTRSWEQYTDTFDSDGIRIARDMIFDDGRTVETTYDDGLRVTQISIDVDDQKVWDMINQTFDENGKVASKTTTYDDGRVTQNTYVDGTRATTVSQDLDDAKRWTENRKIFEDNGDIQYGITVYDDGRTVETTYEGGERTQLVHSDLEDVKSWKEITLSFDENGKIETRQTVLDTDWTVIVAYEGEVRQSTTTVDGGGEHDWQSRTVTYDQTGQQSSLLVVFDDGTEEFTDYQPPAESTVSLIGQSDETLQSGPSSFDPFAVMG